MILRSYKPSDLSELITLFHDTVQAINSKDYSQEQIDAWTSGQCNLNKWNQSLLNNYSLVAVQNNQIVGFGDIDQTGYLDRLFIHKDFQGRGIATKICNALESHFTVNKITVHASITAKPFFEKRGYKTIKKQEVERKNTILTNYIMEKSRSL